MLKRIALAAVAAAAFAAVDAQAFPAAAPAAGAAGSEVTLAAGGCGPGWHRGPYGGCRRNAGPIIVAPRPVIVAPRACPRGWHLGPRGRACVRNY